MTVDESFATLIPMNPIVVKIGGSTLGSHDPALLDLATIATSRPVIVVHGGGKAISQWLDRIGVQSRFVRGLRVTDATSLETVVAVLAGIVNKTLVSQLLSVNVNAVGLSGVDGGMVRAVPVSNDLGFVGSVSSVNVEPINALLAKGLTPVIAPLGLDDSGQIFNINADTVAAAIAGAVTATEMVMLSDIPGVKDANGEILRELPAKLARQLIANGVIAGGMIPKVDACLQAGVPARIADGREENAIQRALAGEIGTRIVPNEQANG